MKKRYLMILLILGLLAYGYIQLVQDAYRNRSNCPAPENLKEMEVYQYLSENIREDMTADQLAQTFSKMCEMAVECRDDMLLIESSYHQESGSYDIYMVRQFEFSDSSEFVQLSLCVTYHLEDPDAAVQTTKWYDTDRVDIGEILAQWKALDPIGDQQAERINVSIDWTW